MQVSTETCPIGEHRPLPRVHRRDGNKGRNVSLGSKVRDGKGAWRGCPAQPRIPSAAPGPTCSDGDASPGLAASPNAGICPSFWDGSFLPWKLPASGCAVALLWLPPGREARESGGDGVASTGNQLRDTDVVGETLPSCALGSPAFSCSVMAPLFTPSLGLGKPSWVSARAGHGTAAQPGSRQGSEPPWHHGLQDMFIPKTTAAELMAACRWGHAWEGTWLGLPWCWVKIRPERCFGKTRFRGQKEQQERGKITSQ